MILAAEQVRWLSKRNTPKRMVYLAYLITRLALGMPYIPMGSSIWNRLLLSGNARTSHIEGHSK